MVRSPSATGHNTNDHVVNGFLHDLMLMVGANGRDGVDELRRVLAPVSREPEVRTDFAMHAREQRKSATAPAGFGSQRRQVANFVANKGRAEVVQDGQHDAARCAGAQG